MNLQIMDCNAQFVSFHTEPFANFPLLLSPSPTLKNTLLPLTSPSSINTSTMPSSEIESAKQKVIKQCQFFICYVINELMFSLNTMKKIDKAKLMYENYHGVEGKPHVLQHVGLFTQCTGKGKFATIMEKLLEDGTTRLKTEATQEPEHSFVVNEVPIAGDNSKVITLRLLQCKSIKSDVIFSQRSIERYAEVAVRNCKQATAAGMQFLQANGTLAPDFLERY